MKIVFYGDSNTWGFDPETGARQKERFIELLRRKKPDWTIIDEGLNGRMLWIDRDSSPYNGSLDCCRALEAAAPFDVFVIMLGTNDLRNMDCRNEEEFQRRLRLLGSSVHSTVEMLKAKGRLKKDFRILLVQPPFLNEKALERDPFSQFGRNAVCTLNRSDFAFKSAASFYGMELLLQDASNAVSGGWIDGVHLDIEGHRKMAHHFLMYFQDE